MVRTVKRLPFALPAPGAFDRGGNFRLAFSSRTTLDRREFDLVGGNRFNPAFDLESAVIEDHVEVAIDGLAFNFNVAAWEYDSGDPPSVGEWLGNTIGHDDHEEAIRRFEDLRATAPDSLNFSPLELAKLGYRLLAQDQTDAALAVFELGARWPKPTTVPGRTSSPSVASNGPWSSTPLRSPRGSCCAICGPSSSADSGALVRAFHGQLRGAHRAVAKRESRRHDGATGRRPEGTTVRGHEGMTARGAEPDRRQDSPSHCQTSVTPSA